MVAAVEEDQEVHLVPQRTEVVVAEVTVVQCVEMDKLRVRILAVAEAVVETKVVPVLLAVKVS